VRQRPGELAEHRDAAEMRQLSPLLLDFRLPDAAR